MGLRLSYLHTHFTIFIISFGLQPFTKGHPLLRTPFFLLRLLMIHTFQLRRVDPIGLTQNLLIRHIFIVPVSRVS